MEKPKVPFTDKYNIFYFTISFKLFYILRTTRELYRFAHTNDLLE